MSQINEASKYQIERLRAIRQSRAALFVIRHRLDRLSWRHTKDAKLDEAFGVIMDKIGSIEAETWNNIAMLSPVDDEARKAIYDRTLAWFKEDSHSIAYMLGFYDSYPVATEEKFRSEVMEMFREH